MKVGHAWLISDLILIYILFGLKFNKKWKWYEQPFKILDLPALMMRGPILFSGPNNNKQTKLYLSSQ